MRGDHLVKALLLVTLTQGDRDFHNTISKQEVYKYSEKKWHHYVRSSIHIKLLSEVKDKIFNMYTLLLRVWKFGGTFIIYSKQKLESHSKQSKIIRASGNIFFETLPEQPYYKLLKCIFYRCLYTWHFNSSFYLSLVLNFYQVHFSSSAVDCVFGNFSISLANDAKCDVSKNQQIFYVCGSYSSFSVYPKTMGIFLLKLYTGIRIKYHLNVSFEVVDAKFIVTHQLNYTSFLHTTLINVKDHYFLYIFRIQVKKNMYIKIEVEKRFNLIVFDGPGFQSNILKKGKATYKTTTFQCIVQLLEISLFTGYLTHTAQTLTISQQIKVKNQMSLTLPAKHQTPFTLSIGTSHGSYINISLISMKSKSQFFNYPECIFGGISIFEELNNLFDEIQCICENFKPILGFSRNVYSSGPLVTIFFYWYKEYSEIKVELNISNTKCQVIIIDPCAAKYFCVPCIHTRSKKLNCKLNTDCLSTCEGGNSNISCQKYLNKVTQFTDVKLTTSMDKWRVTYLFSMHYETCFVLQFKKQFSSEHLSSKVNDINRCFMSLAPSPVPYGQVGFKLMITGQLNGETYHVPFKAVSFQNKNFNRTYCNIEFKQNTTKCPNDVLNAHYIRTSHFQNINFLIHSEVKLYLSGSLTVRHDTMPSLQNWVDVIVWKTKLKETQHISETVPVPVSIYSLKKVSDKLDDVLYLKAQVNSESLFPNMKFTLKILSNYYYTDYLFYWASNVNFHSLQPEHSISLPEIMNRVYIKSDKWQNKLRLNYTNVFLNILWISDNYRKYSVQSYMCKIKPLGVPSATTCFYFSSLELNRTYIYFKERHPYEGLKTSKINNYKDLLSWNKAAQLCREVGGYLPYFTNMNELAELIALMKFSKDILPLEAIYIGLNFNNNKQVNIHCVNIT